MHHNEPLPRDLAVLPRLFLRSRPDWSRLNNSCGERRCGYERFQRFLVYSELSVEARREPGPARGFFLLKAGVFSVERHVNKEELG